MYLYLALLDGVCLCVNVFYARLFRKVKRRISRSPSDFFFFQSIAYVLSVFSHFFLSVRTFKCDRFSAIPLLHTCRYTHLRGTGNEREREGRNQLGTDWHCPLHQPSSLYAALSVIFIVGRSPPESLGPLFPPPSGWASVFTSFLHYFDFIYFFFFCSRLFRK